jgi:hypothetical protein
MPKKNVKVEITDLEAALSLVGKMVIKNMTHDDVLAYNSDADRVVVVVQPGPKYVFTRAEIEAEKDALRRRSSTNAAQDA